MPKIIQT